MSKPLKKALFSLALLAAFGVLIAWLSIVKPPAKEFVGTIAGGIVSVGALIYSAQSRDEAKKAEVEARESRAAGERAEAEAREGRAAGERAEKFAAEGATEARASREKAESAEKLACASNREKRKIRKVAKKAANVR